MHYEFALDPCAMADWPTACRMYEGFGFEHGRLLAPLPEKSEWCRRVADESKTAVLNRRLLPVKRKSIVEKWVPIMVECMAPHERSFDGAIDWLSNAEREHRSNRFRLILSITNPRGQEHVKIASELLPDDPNWLVPREAKVPRTARELARVSQLLVAASREVLLVDPHFNPSDIRWRESLQTFLQPCTGFPPGSKRIELHVEEDKKSNEKVRWRNWFLEACRDHLPFCVPRGHPLQVMVWRQRDDGEHLHPRYVLTEKGGIRFESGLDPGTEGETTDVTLLGRNLLVSRWADYQRASSPFELVDETVVSGRA